MKICIFGAGAIGGYLAVGLARVEGVTVSVIARGAHLEAIRNRGLRLDRVGRCDTVSVHATEDPGEIGPQDYVIVCLKAHQAWDVADRMKPLFHDDTAVVTCQNGVPWWYFHALGGPFEGRRIQAVDPEGRQWREIGPERAIGCVVYPATEISEPGVIRHVYGDKFALGEPDGNLSERCLRLSKAMEAGGLRAPVLADIRSEIWLKLWGNLCFNPISALTRATLDRVATESATRQLAQAMMTEAEAIATRLGATFRVDMERRINGAAGVGPHRTSMLQDLERGRTLEIDALVTAVREMGKIVEVETPATDIVLGLVCQLAAVKGLYPAFPDLASSPPIDAG
ncbi:MAG: 2-dehydropantoate 2-reductase [Paracoccaceae bacterium]|nr:2-dehydropantoate 2-reductase [Paracoccaceae bacterium]MDE2913136.1 2-dehydropantoate 2-reductase [Paracoccaceae bacterium]